VLEKVGIMVHSHRLTVRRKDEHRDKAMNESAYRRDKPVDLVLVDSARVVPVCLSVL